ncbi:hypothetical protein F4813DRAFT_372595 [Daldinia decipiens]|uniref:uncharacterized protein n=1 Tax=Daldinia decipiens TaxID=326647 RepID=UPI0020C3422A|nr:uncharacterized protein F4813DRAFT_372595 [Daldinia decipiens]KAI1653952.1 hypothetical protein F4813DRAFT_372595 [Daldinia decipiens]
MTVFRTLTSPTTNVWYLAYGSNLSSTKFTHDRGIVPISIRLVTVPGWTLSLDSAGVPYSEPAFASISPVDRSENEKYDQLVGTAYELTPGMYTEVLASEGGGIAYAEIEVRAQVLYDDNTEPPQGTIAILATRSLITLLRREARPSIRYMGLLREGAAESCMPISYQKFLAQLPVYHPPRKPFCRVGAAIFLAFWVPVMSIMERVTKASLKNRKTGTAPDWVIIMVRAVVWAMWSYHDFVHAPIWGRGDGMGSA